MKKIARATNLFVLLFALAAAGCSKGSDSQDQTSADSSVVKQKQAEAFTSSINIRYIDMDSIGQNYNLAKDFQDLYIRTLSNLEQQRRAKAAELQKLGESIDQKMRSNGYLSEASYNADVADFQKKQNDAQNYLTNLQNRAEQELADQQKQVLDSIQSFIIDYNKTHKYDAILQKSAGVYFNPALDITAEVIDGLNARYNKVSAQAKE